MSVPSELLMERVKAGDDQAFDSLVDRHSRSLYNFIARSVGEASDAEDLLQTTFLKILQSAASFDSRQKFTTWAYRIAGNLCVDHWRRAQLRKTVSLDQPLPGAEEGAAEPTAADLLREDRPGPGAEFEAKLLHQHLRGAIDRLSSEHRSVVMLAYFEGLPYPEIAEILEIPVGTVKSRMHHAMHRLREQLREWM